MEFVHAAVPTVEVHTLPQPPQFETLTVISVSQPSLMPFTQSAWLASHLMVQVLVAGSAQVALPPFAEQWLSQVPQVSGELRLASQPFLGSPSQSSKPGLHVTLQTPSVQTPLPFAGMHLWSQAPQWAGAVSVSISQPFAGSPSQSEWPLAQLGTHAPSLHVVVPNSFVHAVSQAPQWSMSVCKLISQPFVPSASQSSNPSSHAMLQPSALHEGVP
jgi:hypothetical protein